MEKAYDKLTSTIMMQGEKTTTKKNQNKYKQA